MVKLIATKAHTYAGRTIEADEEYEADEPFATTLVSLNRARRADEGTEAGAMTTDDGKKGYKTRRLKAEDESGGSSSAK